MTLASRLLGPASKYDQTLPYTYEARVSVIEWDDAYNSYFSDTICGLVKYLREKNIRPNQVTLFEIYQNHEEPLETGYCLDSRDLWLSKPDLCESLKEHYKGHIQDGHCSFEDRDPVPCGP